METSVVPNTCMSTSRVSDIYDLTTTVTSAWCVVTLIYLKAYKPTSNLHYYLKYYMKV